MQTISKAYIYQMCLKFFLFKRRVGPKNNFTFFTVFLKTTNIFAGLNKTKIFNPIISRNMTQKEEGGEIYCVSDNEFLGSNNLLIIELTFMILPDNKIQLTVDLYMVLYWAGVLAIMPTRDQNSLFVLLVHLRKIKQSQAYLNYF